MKGVGKKVQEYVPDSKSDVKLIILGDSAVGKSKY